MANIALGVLDEHLHREATATGKALTLGLLVTEAAGFGDPLAAG